MESVLLKNVLCPMADGWVPLPGFLGVCNSTDWPRSSHDVTAHWHSLSMLITADSRARFSQNRPDHLSYYCAAQPRTKYCTGSGEEHFCHFWDKSSMLSGYYYSRVNMEYVSIGSCFDVSSTIHVIQTI